MNKAPKHLSLEARKLWAKIAQEITLDAPAELLMVLLCEAYDRRAEARAAIAQGGAVFTDRFGQLKPSPWCGIERDQTLIIQRNWRLLGFDLAEENA